jgi:TonB family protein
MAASVRLALLLVGCATAPTALPSNAGDAPELSDFKAHFPEFYEKARARLDREFHGREVAERSSLGPGRWRVVVRIDLDPVGDNQGCRLLRSSGFNAIDDEAVAACRRVKDMLFPPEEAVEADRRAHVPVQLVVER